MSGKCANQDSNGQSPDRDLSFAFRFAEFCASEKLWIY